MTPVMTPSLGGFLSPLSTPVTPMVSTGIQLTAASFIPMKTTEILNKISGGGLSVVSRFTRSPHLFSTAMVSIELVFSNQGMEEIADIRVGQKVTLVFVCCMIVCLGRWFEWVGVGETEY
jgi:hypothetical protein